MTIQYSVTHQNNNVADITTQLSTTPYLLIYTGGAPAHCSTASSGTLLASLPGTNPFGAAPSSGVLTASAITSENTGNAGTAGYWRLTTSSAGTTVVAQGTVAVSGGDLNFAGGVIWTSGETIGITSFTVTANGA